MKRYLIAIVVILVFTLTGCPGSKKITIGAVLPLSGNLGNVGQAVKDGIDAAMIHLKSDTTYPYKITIAYKDSQSNPDLAKELLYKVFNEGALCAIGGVSSGEALQMSKVINKERRILLSPTASSPKLRGISPYFFRIYPSDIREVSMLVNHTATHLKGKSLALIYQEGDYGTAYAELYRDSLQQVSSIPLKVVPIAGNLERHDLTIANLISTTKPDAVCLVGYPEALINFLKDLKNGGFDGPILTSSAITAPGVLARCGAMSKGLVFCKPPYEIDQESNPLVEDFLTIFDEHFGRTPNILSGFGYDALLVLADAIKNQGTYTDDIIKGFMGLHNFEGVTGKVVFTPGGDVNKPYRVFTCLGDVQVDYNRFKEYRKKRLKKLIIDLNSGKTDAKMDIPSRQELENFSRDDLKKLARAIGLEAQGSKEVLIKKICRVLEKVKLK